MNILAIAQDANYTEWFAITFLVSLAAFPILWVYAWLRLSNLSLSSRERLRLSAKTAARSILPLWMLTGVVGFFVVTLGVIAFLWLYALFISPTGGTNLSENQWLLYGPYCFLFIGWYIFSVVCVIRWLPEASTSAD